MKQLTFESVCKQLKKENVYKDIVEKLDAISGATILLLGVKGIGNQVNLFLDALTVKDELINIGKSVIERIIENKTNVYDKRINLMKWAYSIIYYTAFFDVLDEQLPKEIREGIALTLNEKKDIFEKAEFGEKGKKGVISEKEIQFPSILYNYTRVEADLKELYSSMCEGLRKFVHLLAFEEISDEKTVKHFYHVLENLPKLAIERFQAQYLYLASNFNEFYIYMQIESSKNKEIYIEKSYKELITVCNESKEKIDVGLQNLERIMLELPEKIYEEKVNNIVDSLVEGYRREIEKPIIEAKNKDEKIQYPSISEAFIPQSYQIVEYTGNEKLEKEKTWREEEVYDEMDTFWANYFVSPYSLENILLILGEPGGGKSLLTKIICARMIDHHNIFIRVPLREINVEKEIETIICEQIQKDGDASEPIPTFKWFADNFKYNPVTIVFDGYDEVLQATGGVYRSFLNKILRFQQLCEEKHRPIRVVVTSRDILIDKAEIPVGTTVLKLLEFNAEQRDHWIQIWNQNNKEVFKRENIEVFKLPDNNKSIEELSKQPLLLLMLAIYDANIEEGINSLGQEDVLNRTRLYNELLRRFIKRELKKGTRGTEISYDEVGEEERELMINEEMERLGIAALGMFIRGKLSLKVSELEKDITYMEIETPKYETAGRMLKNAEILFGSFFFIHDSQSGSLEEDVKEEAFEFLHKTFYEFLVAHLVLKYLVEQIDELNELRCLRNKNNYQKAIDNPDHLGRRYYVTLINTYLFTEPEIIEMLLEWKEDIIKAYFTGQRQEFDITMLELFNNQICTMCDAVFMPSVWKESFHESIPEKSYFKYCAIYLANILVLQTLVSQSQKSIIQNERWIYISQFLKMNVPEEILLKFTALFNINKKKDGIYIEKNYISGKSEQKNRFEIQLDISNFLQDDFTSNLLMLHDETIPNNKKQKYRLALSKKGIDIPFEILLGEVQEYIFKNNNRFSLDRNMHNACKILDEHKVDTVLVFNWLVCINKCVEVTPHSEWRGRIEEILIDIVLRQYKDNVSIVLEIFKFIKRIGAERVFRRRIKAVQRGLKYWMYNRPEIVLEILKSEINLIKYDLVESLVEEFQNNFFEIFEIAPETSLELLETFCKFAVSEKLDYLFDAILMKWEHIYMQSPRAMSKLIKLCGQLNKEKILINLFNNNIAAFEKMIEYYPEIAMDLLEFIQIKTEGKVSFDFIFSYLIKNVNQIIDGQPKKIAQLVRIAIMFNNVDEVSDLAHIICKRYNKIFRWAPNEAVEFYNTACINEMNGENRRMIMYLLEHYTFLLDHSINSAIDLLLLHNDDIKQLDTYVKECFNSILYGTTAVKSERMLEVLDILDATNIEILGAYFENKYSYIVLKYPLIAKKLAECYCYSNYKYNYLEKLNALHEKGLINIKLYQELKYIIS